MFYYLCNKLKNAKNHAISAPNSGLKCQMLQPNFPLVSFELPNLANIIAVTNNGERGLMSYQRLQYVNDCIKSDQEEFKYVPTAGESDAQALINMLSTRARQKKDIRFCYLYTKPETAADAEVFTSMTMVTGHDGQTFSSSDGPSEGKPATWLSTLREFASDAWGRVVGTSVHDSEPPPRKKVAKKVWPADKRKFKVGAHTMLLVAILWCTVGEQLLFAKYPELLGHDTKGVVSDVHGHWLYTVGMRENGYTFIAMRGLLANQTLAMFKWVMEVALPYLHGSRLRGLRAHMCDGDPQLCDALDSISQRDGPSPFATLLRCGWHIIDRAIIRVFGSANKAWHRSLTRAFWMWQQLETLQSVLEFREWLQNDFFTAPCIQEDMSPKDKIDFQGFIWSLWNTRKFWSRAFNMELGVFDARTNSFVEVQNAVLTEDVGVSAQMKIVNTVKGEGRIFGNKSRRLEHGHFQRLIRPLSTSRKIEGPICCDVAKKFMCPKPLKRLIRQVQLATSCLRNTAESQYGVCPSEKWEDCSICSKMLLDTQKELLRSSSGSVRLHLFVRVEESLNKKVRFDNLEYSFSELLKSAPVKKQWRVVTCLPHGDYILLRCSCGHGMRHLTLCLHCSLVIQRATGYTCSGCEEENIHIRHCELYAGLEDISKVHRTATDWIGIRCKHVTIESIRANFDDHHGSDADDEYDNEDGTGAEETSGPASHGTRQRTAADEANAVFAASKAAKLHISRNHYFELQHIADEAGNDEVEFARRHQILEEGLLAIKKKMPSAVGGGSARATHTAADYARRRKRPAPASAPAPAPSAPAPARTSVASAPAPAPAPSQMYATIQISSDDASDWSNGGRSEWRNGGGSASD